MATEDEIYPRRRRRPLWTLISVLLLAALAAWVIVFFHRRAEARRAAEAAARAIHRIPVVVSPVVKKDVPVYLEGLGTVQAYNTVTIHVRVDGKITKIGFKEGEDVKKGDFLLSIDPAPYEAQLAQAEAQKKQNEAQLSNALRDLERFYRMYQQKVIPQQQYDTQVALVDQLVATVAANQAVITNQRVQLGYTTITAPIDGRVGLRLIDQGNIVHANDQNGILTINQLHPISVVFTLPEQNLHAIQTEMAVRPLAVYALDRSNKGAPISTGELTVFDNQIDTATGTIKLKATFKNDDLRLWPGQFVNTRLLLKTVEGGVVVPSAAVQRGPEGTFAFVVKKDDTVTVRRVTVTQTQLGESLIAEGLRPGEEVVSEGQYRLQENSPIRRVKPSAPAAPTPTPSDETP